MKKSIYTLFLLLICLFSFAGCGKTSEADNSLIFETNAFRIVRQATNDGQIVLSYIFPLNSSYLASLGFEEDEIKTYRFYLTTYVNALAQSNREKETEGATVGTCSYYTDVDGIGFSVQFENLEAQKRFFGVEDDERESVSSKQKISGFFIKKLEISTTFPVSSSKSAGDLKMICVMAISSWCNNDNISDTREEEILKNLDEAVYIYDFATQEKGLQSQLMYQDDYFYHNVFIKTLGEIEQDNQIIFLVTYANRPVWYAFALLLVLFGVGASLAILRIKKKKRSK